MKVLIKIYCSMGKHRKLKCLQGPGRKYKPNLKEGQVHCYYLGMQTQNCKIFNFSEKSMNLQPSGYFLSIKYRLKCIEQKRIESMKVDKPCLEACGLRHLYLKSRKFCFQKQLLHQRTKIYTGYTNFDKAYDLLGFQLPQL